MNCFHRQRVVRPAQCVPLLFAASLYLAFATGSALRAQENFGLPETDSLESRITIRYGSAVAHVATTVEIPFYFTAPFPVGVIESELRLPKGVLEFVKARKSDVLEAAGGADLETSVMDDAKGKTFSVLRLSVRYSGDSSNQALPTG